MSVFTEVELDYLTGNRLLGRLATVGANGMPHVAPVGWRLDADVVVITGRNFSDTKKFRDVAATGRAAIVIDDVLPPWQARGVEIRGRAEAVEAPEPQIRIRPTRIASWGLDGERSARTVRPDPTGPPANGSPTSEAPTR
ncbi:MAG: PPOX class F420-dependent oxidoreductase [Micromonosporaceae bacterium]|nr:PPOX class F420-dependent oxidoreductase [Micromonosporaceae bacterium]